MSDSSHRSWSEVVRGWLSGPATVPIAAEQGDPAARSGVDAVVATEAMLSDALCWYGPSDPSPGGSPENAFGRPVEIRRCDSGAGAVARVSGLAMTGVRATALLSSSAARQSLDALTDAVERHIPLVAHVAESPDGRPCLSELAGTGALLFVARGAQHASDLCLVARHLGERALLPAVIVMDPRVAVAPQEVRLPAGGALRELLGDPRDLIAAPTPAQETLFGAERALVPQWFDLGSPVLTGALCDGADLAGRVFAQDVMFAGAVSGLVGDSVDAVSTATGRSQDLLCAHRIEDARVVVVATGAVATVAEAAADRVRTETGTKVGVLALQGLRPLPEAGLRDQLARAERVVVLAPASDPLAGASWLAREVQGVLAGRGLRVATAAFVFAGDGPTVRQVGDALVAPGQGERALMVGVGDPAADTRFPKREAALQAMARSHPGITARLAPATLQDRDSEAPAAQEPSAAPEAASPSAAARRVSTAAPYASTARFFGEVSEPRLAGEVVAAVPDPRLGIVPPHASPGSASASAMPRIDPDKCIGCGACWVGCPDSAIAPVALGTGALLDAAADMATAPGAERDPLADKLRRAHKQLASRVDTALAKDERTTLSADLLASAFEWLAGKMKLEGDERAGMLEAFGATVDVLRDLPLSATAPLFHEAHRAEKGQGTLLLLVVDPSACSGCGLCDAVCAEEAIAMEPVDSSSVHLARTRWAVWEQLPDTSGATITRAKGVAAVGPLAAVMMSRHCLFSVAGGDHAEAGSGERVALRQVTAVVERHAQALVLGRLARLEQLEGEVRDAVRQAMTDAVSVDDLASLEKALSAVPARPANMPLLVAKLDELGERTTVDIERVRALTHAALSLRGLSLELAEGEGGTGRARFGLVLSRGSVARWAAAFPRNTFGVPVAVDLGEGGASVAQGLAEGLSRHHVEELRLLRRAELLVAAPSDLQGQLRAIERLSWKALTDDERAACPRVVLIAGPEALTDRGMAALSGLLCGDLPIAVLLLGDADPTRRAEPALLALAHRGAFVLNASIAYPSHLHDGVQAALSSSAPALWHVYAPSPSRHGFEPAQTMERARLATASRVHPLCHYDPARAGVFGTRLSLEGNPEPTGDLAEGATPADFASGEARFAGVEIEPWAEGRLAIWRVLQELAGVVTPFTDAIRASADEDAAAAQQDKFKALEAEHAAALAASQGERDAAQFERLRARLLQLAGHPAPKPPESKPS